MPIICVILICSRQKMQPLSAAITVDDEIITVVYESGPIPVATSEKTQPSAVIIPKIIAEISV